MIAQLRGTLCQKDGHGAVVECAGVGYAVAMSDLAQAQLPAVGAAVTVLVYTHVAADSLRLYGFVEAQERDAFAVLLATPGVGPRLALAILSQLTAPMLYAAVQQGARQVLCDVPGVGPKKAARLLVDLKGRLAPTATASSAPAPQGLRADLVSALHNIGFAQPIAERAADLALQAAPATTDLTALMRRALQCTTQRL